MDGRDRLMREYSYEEALLLATKNRGTNKSGGKGRKDASWKFWGPDESYVVDPDTGGKLYPVCFDEDVFMEDSNLSELQYCSRCGECGAAGLHGHHMEGVAGGGSDHPINIVLLCPTCHDLAPNGLLACLRWVSRIRPPHGGWTGGEGTEGILPMIEKIVASIPEETKRVLAHLPAEKYAEALVSVVGEETLLGLSSAKAAYNRTMMGLA